MRPEQILTSGWAAAAYLAHEHPEIRKVYVIGSEGLVTELEEQGITCSGGPNDCGKTITDEEVARIPADPTVQAVVVGHDFGWSFYKLVMGSLYLQQGALFVVTNRDNVDRVGPWMMPVNGTQVLAPACLLRLP